jgi:hypothetical protein
VTLWAGGDDDANSEQTLSGAVAGGRGSEVGSSLSLASANVGYRPILLIH